MKGDYGIVVQRKTGTEMREWTGQCRKFGNEGMKVETSGEWERD